MKALNIIVLIFIATVAFAQTKIDQERMSRDIEIAENALGTLIKQKFDKRNIWLDIKASYTPGYGVTMRIPNDNFSVGYDYKISGNGRAVMAPVPAVGVNSRDAVIVYDYDHDDNNAKPVKEKDAAKLQLKRQNSTDSAKTAYYGRLIEASIAFITDYGDLLSQLPAEEKILITNRGEGGGRFYYDSNQKRRLVTIEGTKGDIVQFKQGKMTRDQIMSKIKIVNTESTNEIETDLELLSSILSRLYRSDLSKTFYSDDNIYYERLKDFGVIYYMSAYSSNEQYRKYERNGDVNAKDQNQGKLWSMPTQRLEGLTQEQRDKKVVELYPQFEKDLKDNIVEYAQTVKSLKDDEMFVVNVTITKCIGCNIPSTLELSLKNSQVRKMAAGQATKAEVIAAISVKKGPNQ